MNELLFPYKLCGEKEMMKKNGPTTIDAFNQIRLTAKAKKLQREYIHNRYRYRTHVNNTHTFSQSHSQPVRFENSFHKGNERKTIKNHELWSFIWFYRPNFGTEDD